MIPYYEDAGIRLYQGSALDVLREMPGDSVNCVVTSPPYWGLRDYGVEGQLGLEPTPGEYIANMVEIFREIRRVLRSDGTCWVNMGDSYTSTGGARDHGWQPETNGRGELNSYPKRGDAKIMPRNRQQKDCDPKRRQSAQFGVYRGSSGSGLKPKDLVGMPWRLALALQDDGWYLRQDIIWHKSNPMPESVTDRCTKAHEYIFLLSKSESYFYDAEAIKEKVSGNAHSRGGGVNPKAKREGQNSRMRVDRDPKHIGYSVPGNKSHRGITLYEQGDARHRTKVGLVKYAEKARARAKQNDSFSAAVTEIVLDRNKRDVWTMATAPFKEAHFATFPPALPTTCIKAATSEKGVCAICGNPLGRIMEAYDTGIRQKMADGWDAEPGRHDLGHRSGRSTGEQGQVVVAYRTVGWKDCCALFGAGASPAVVLDPFSGAATTGLAALKLGRAYIGIELSAEYAAMSKRRLAQFVSITTSVESEAL